MSDDLQKAIDGARNLAREPRFAVATKAALRGFIDNLDQILKISPQGFSSFECDVSVAFDFLVLIHIKNLLLAMQADGVCDNNASTQVIAITGMFEGWKSANPQATHHARIMNRFVCDDARKARKILELTNRLKGDMASTEIAYNDFLNLWILKETPISKLPEDERAEVAPLYVMTWVWGILTYFPAALMAWRLGLHPAASVFICVMLLLTFRMPHPSIAASAACAYFVLLFHPQWPYALAGIGCFVAWGLSMYAMLPYIHKLASDRHLT